MYKDRGMRDVMNARDGSSVGGDKKQSLGERLLFTLSGRLCFRNRLLKNDCLHFLLCCHNNQNEGARLK